MSEKTIVTKLQLIESYKIKVKSDLEYIPELIVDETIPVGKGSGLNPTRRLSTAVGHCMSSSLIYCLKKARIPINHLDTAVKTNLYQNENGRLRIRSIDLQINLKIKLQLIK